MSTKPKMKDVSTATVAQLVSGLWESNHDKIVAELGATDANKLTVSVSLKVRSTSDGLAIKGKIGYGAKHTDEAECEVSDPAQEKLPL